MNSPAREFNTTSTPSPPVQARMSSAKLTARDVATCSTPRLLRYSCLVGLPAVAKISAPMCLAI